MAPLILHCESLTPALSELQSSYSLLSICPADAPVAALLGTKGASPDDARVALVVNGENRWEEAIRVMQGGDAVVLDANDNGAEWIVNRSGDESGEGRAGMRYRDLIPGRLGGRVVASLISIPDGGPVADYVHHHRIDFQMIFCRSGSVRVVYESQGPPFDLHAGDCVIQPPHIRHRVLEASKGLEVVEIASPAVHATYPDPGMELPGGADDPGRSWGGQTFVRHIAESAEWQEGRGRWTGWEERDLGIGLATGGTYKASVARSKDVGEGQWRAATHGSDLIFWFVLDGQVEIQKGDGSVLVLLNGDSLVVPKGEFSLRGSMGAQLLEVEFA
ncbi:hypothetical protein M427DRAFT_34440 [Gonapodya prolifera JEL478]|uniref:Cupin type-2 domain-containing protein n=1 Tax=Gonapodya prolifera (strain JEL478) TaxID=1344416 RepID=A0A139A8M4_GONPJ|nr:hypothetical protein M427DRAFT_34440 [Gonapodya prolifera JEL478]|eukprot:KXS12805.1 hypothetical protein M427DRAFT_34440 [Gonapodya prolifera JEL478]